MWALISNNKPREFITDDPEGKYHPDIEFFKVPDYIAGYATTDYSLTEAGLLPPSADYLHRQFSQKVINKTNQILNSGLKYQNQRYDISFIHAVIPYFLHKMELFYYQDRFGIVRNLPFGKVEIIYKALLNYQQGCFINQNNILIELEKYLKADGVVDANLEETIKFANDLIGKGWPSNEIKEEEQ